jgi:hypothetical protein
VNIKYKVFLAASVVIAFVALVCWIDSVNTSCEYNVYYNNIHYTINYNTVELPVLTKRIFSDATNLKPAWWKAFEWSEFPKSGNFEDFYLHIDDSLFEHKPKEAVQQIYDQTLAFRKQTPCEVHEEILATIEVLREHDVFLVIVLTNEGIKQANSNAVVLNLLKYDNMQWTRCSPDVLEIVTAFDFTTEEKFAKSIKKYLR